MSPLTSPCSSNVFIADSVSISPTVLPTESIIGNKRCRIIDEINAGVFSTIYHAYDNHKQCEVALKIQRPGISSKYLIKEYEILKSL